MVTQQFDMYQMVLNHKSNKWFGQTYRPTEQMLKKIKYSFLFNKAYIDIKNTTGLGVCPFGKIITYLKTLSKIYFKTYVSYKIKILVTK